MFSFVCFFFLFNSATVAMSPESIYCHDVKKVCIDSVFAKTVRRNSSIKDYQVSSLLLECCRTDNERLVAQASSSLLLDDCIIIDLSGMSFPVARAAIRYIVKLLLLLHLLILLLPW